MVEDEYNFLVNQKRFRAYFYNLRVIRLLKDRCNELSALEKVYNLKRKSAPVVTSSDRGEAHKI